MSGQSTVRGGEAYELTGPDPDALLGAGRPVRIEIYQAAQRGARVRCVDADGGDWWTFVPLADGRVPAGWQLVGLAKPHGRMWDGREVWRVPGPPWGRDLCWAGPGAPLIEHGEGQRPGWLGPELGRVTDPCQTITHAQAAADAWWLAAVAAEGTRTAASTQPGPDEVPA